jgi:serine/threonine protein kinase
MPRFIANRFLVEDEPFDQGGGHANIHRGTDGTTHEAVAVKEFDPVKLPDESMLKRAWSRELEALQALSHHKNLVRLVDFDPGHHGTGPLLVLEWVDGGNLLNRVKAMTDPGWDDIESWLIDALDGLAVLHREGWVHRDLKPQNVLIDVDGVAKLSDFGLARTVESVNAILGKTLSGLGTRPFAPPEVATDSPTPAYDLYSFAAMAVVLLRDRGGGTSTREEVLSLLAGCDLHPQISALLERCLEEHPEKRPATAAELVVDLRHLQAERHKVRVGDQALRVWIALTDNVRSQITGHLGTRVETVAALVLDEINDIAALRTDPTEEGETHLEVAGQASSTVRLSIGETARSLY